MEDLAVSANQVVHPREGKPKPPNTSFPEATTASFLQRALLYFQQQGTSARKLLTDNGSANDLGLSHMKSDGLLEQYFLKGVVGDMQNIILCGADHNMRRNLAHLSALFHLLTGETRKPISTLITLLEPQANSSALPITARSGSMGSSGSTDYGVGGPIISRPFDYSSAIIWVINCFLAS